MAFPDATGYYNAGASQFQSSAVPPDAVLQAMGITQWDPSQYSWDPVNGILTDRSNGGTLNFGDYSTGDPSLGTNVVTPNGTQNFAEGTTPVFSDVGNADPFGLPTQDAYNWYADQKAGNQKNFLEAAAALIGGPALVSALSGAGGAGAAGNVAAGGGAGSGSAAGGAVGGELSPITLSPGVGYIGSGAAQQGLLGAVGSALGNGAQIGDLLETAGMFGGSPLLPVVTSGIPGAAAGGAGAGAANAMIDPALAQSVYGDMLNPPPIEPISLPPGVNTLPTTVPPTPLDPNATMQPFPSPPVGLTPPVGNVAPPGGSGNGNVNAPPAASNVPDWLKYLIPGIDALGQYEAASKSSQAQADALNVALGEQKREFDLTRGDYAPYLAAGTNALGKLQDPTTNFQASPDYAFRKSEGTRGVLNGYNAAGGAFSGNALKALDEFNSNLASGEFGNWWNHQAGLAGIGQSATNGAAQAGQANSNAQSNLLGQLGDARGTGIAGQWGAVGGLANNLFKYLYPQRP